MPETGGKCWCKADVPLVKEEVIREYLKKRDFNLEESDRNHRILEGPGLEMTLKIIESNHNLTILP